MRFLIIIISILFYLPLSAQTNVVKRTAIKANNYGVAYSLPKTSFAITAEVIKTTTKSGPYYQYAERYLGIRNPIIEDNTFYELGEVTLTNVGIPDSDNSYMVDFKAGTVAPYVYLTEEGLICAVNAEYAPDESATVASERGRANTVTATDASVFSEELLMAGTIARQAEVAAKQIFRIRESRLNILTGEADNLPPDGEAMRIVIGELEAQEKALTNLFTGVTTSTSAIYEMTMVPHDDLTNEVLFRFSSQLGILDADDLGGAPVYMNLKATEKAPVLDPKEAEKKAKTMNGLIYNLPGKASVEILMNQKTLYKADVQVVQFGTQESLAKTMFEDKKTPVKVLFYPETGAIRQIMQ